MKPPARIAQMESSRIVGGSAQTQALLRAPFFMIIKTAHRRLRWPLRMMITSQSQSAPINAAGTTGIIHHHAIAGQYPGPNSQAAPMAEMKTNTARIAGSVMDSSLPTYDCTDRMRAPAFMSFYSVAAPAAEPPPVSTQVLRDAGGNPSNAPAGAYEPVALDANPPASAGNDFSGYRFGGGPRVRALGCHVSPPPFHGAAEQFLKLSQIAQTLRDIGRVLLEVLFALVGAVAILGGLVLLFFF